MYCTAPLSARKGRLRSFHGDDDDDEKIEFAPFDNIKNYTLYTMQ